MKKCRICGMEKKIGEFYKRIDSPDGYRNECKKCCNERSVVAKRKWRAKERLKPKIYIKSCRWCDCKFITDDYKDFYCCGDCNEKAIKEINRKKAIKWKNANLRKYKSIKKESNKKYYEANKHKEEFKEKRRKENTKWRNNNREKIKNLKHLRRAVKKETDITAKWLKELKEKTSICPLCNNEMTNESGIHQYNLDHVITIKIGGTHTMNNVRYICKRCNQSRPDNSRDVPGDNTLNEEVKQRYASMLPPN